MPIPHKKRSKSYDPNWISKVERRRIYKRDNNRCVYCDSTFMLQLDHVKPRARGGTDDPRNLVTACRTCNLAKGAKVIPGRTVQQKVSTYRKERLRALGRGQRGGKRRNRASSVSMPAKDSERHWPWSFKHTEIVLCFFTVLCYFI
jgi:5-methylcytosine-specific restriction endonuclease McrA